MKSVMEHGKYSWLAHAWWLERCRPDLFALRPVVRDTSDIAEQPLLDKISMEQLIENAKLAAEVAANPPPGLAPKQLTSDISVEQCS